jgi:hypothetical protein
VTREGWGRLWRARKAHYFADSRSLCGKWLALSPVPDGRATTAEPGATDCKACHRKAIKRLDLIAPCPTCATADDECGGTGEAS